MGRVVAAAAYADGRKSADIGLDEAGEWAAKDGHFVWIGIHEPNEADLKTLQRLFHLHDLAVEDALVGEQQLPKIESYEDTAFLVLRTAVLTGENLAFGRTEIFMGESFLVTLRHGASASYAEVRRRAEATPNQLAQGVDYVLYAVVDFIVDNYLTAVERLVAEVEALEDRMLVPPLSQAKVTRITELRRQLQRLRLAAAPTADVCRRLEHAELPGIDPSFRPYFRDIIDHLHQVLEEVDTLRERLDFAFQATLLMEQARQGDVTRKLAGWAAILAVPTAIAGIYGMNFENMPELRWHYGYFAVLALMTAICGVLFAGFRRAGWI